tara:strand:+ start:653 stop:814 length:162 start_codon:yes stop_codon:yes gene_type:complete
MITYAKKIKPITTNKPKMTLKKVFQGYKKAEPASKAVNNTNKKKNKKKNKNKY